MLFEYPMEISLKEIQEQVLDLQCKIYEAVQKNEIQTIIKLQKLLVRLYRSDLGGFFKNSLLERNLPFNIYCLRFVDSITCEREVIEMKLHSLDLITESLWPRHALEVQFGKSELNLQIDMIKGLLARNLGVNQRVLVLELNMLKISRELVIKRFIEPQTFVSIFKTIKNSITSNFYSFGFLIVSALLRTLRFANNSKFRSYLSNRTFFYCNDKFFYLLNEDESDIEILNQITRFFTNNYIPFEYYNLELRLLSEGFDFLDWQFLVKFDGELVIKPTSVHWETYKRVIKLVLKKQGLSISSKFYILRSLSLYWSNYMQFCDLSILIDKLRSLRNWCIFYLKRKTKLSKQEKLYLLKYIL